MAGDASDLPGVSDDDLLRRAVKGARVMRGPKSLKHPRWVAVSEQFALGSTYSWRLCVRYGLDPDEKVGRGS